MLQSAIILTQPPFQVHTMTPSPPPFPYFYLSQKISTQNILNLFYFLYHINNFLLLFK
jgi:hypothetical protein